MSPDQSFALRLNNHAAGTFQWNGVTSYTATIPCPPITWMAPNQVGLEAALSQLPGTAYWVSPDWVELTYPATAPPGDRLYIEAAVGAPRSCSSPGSARRTSRRYDVRDARHPVELTTTQAP